MKTIAAIVMAIGRAWPFSRGRNLLLRTVMKRPALVHELSGVGWVTTRHGFKMRVLAGGDYTSTALSLFGSFEPETENFILENVSDGKVFCDVGANMGYFSLLVAHEKPGATVQAFEPNPVIADLLEESVAANGWQSRITVNRCAVGESEGVLPFTVDAVNSGHSRLGGASTAGALNVPVVVIDQWMTAAGLKGKVSCVKMDIEGAELMALRGMNQFLAEHQPAMVLEAYDHQLREFGATRDELMAHLKSAGYVEVAPADSNVYVKPKT